MPKIIKRIYFFVLFLVVPFSAAAQDNLSISQITQSFLKVVDEREHGEKSRGVSKWVSPVQFAVIGSRSDNHSALVRDHFNLLHSVIKLKISEVSPSDIIKVDARRKFNGRSVVAVEYNRSPDNYLTDLLFYDGVEGVLTSWSANFYIFLGSKTELEKYAADIPGLAQQVLNNLKSGKTKCAGFTNTLSATNEIKRAFAFIAVDGGDWLLTRCIEEEITQLFGLYNDIKGSRLTLFNDDHSSMINHLTTLDKLMLAALYHDSIKLKMTGAELDKAARGIIMQLQK